MSRLTNSIAHTIQRHQHLLIVISLVLVALPFVALSCYNHPSLDDFLDAVIVKQLGFWQAQKYFYLHHTGRYATTVLLAIVNPLLYVRMENSWWPVAVGFILITLLVFRLCLALLPGISNGAAWRGAGLLLGVWLAYAPGQAEGLYWLTGAYTYLVTAWLVLLWLVAFVRHTEAQRVGNRGRLWLVGLVGLTVAIAGSTEPVALPFLLLLLTGAGLSGKQRPNRRLLLLLASLAAVGCAVSFSAPGNFVRMSAMGPSSGLVKTVVYSGITAGYLLLTWVGNPVLLALSALLMPTFARVAQQRNTVLVGMLAQIPPGLLAGGLGLLLAAANSPAYYASGTGLPLRARTTLYLFFIIGWFVVLLTWCCRQVVRPQPAVVLQELATSRMAPVWVGLVVLFFFADYNVQTRGRMLGQSSNNVIRAYQQWLNGDAARYDAELRARYKTLVAGSPVVTIYPLRTKPDLLFSFGVTDAPNPMVLRGYGRYFGVQRVVVSKDSR